jgi:hypothetical protein
VTVKSEIARADLMKVYLDCKILQWYGRADGKGVIFIVNATNVDDAKKVMEDLPFEKQGMVLSDYVALTPLTPLRGILSSL